MPDVSAVDRHRQFHRTASYNVLFNNGPVSGAITIDWRHSNVQKITLAANITSVVFIDPPGPCNCRLWIHKAFAGLTITGWDADIDWGGSAPVISAGASKFDIAVFEYDGGSIYAAQLVQGIDGTGFG